MLITADDALISTAEAGDKISENVDKKFKEAIHLLSGFEKDFSSKDLALDSNISGVVTGKAKMSNKSESPLATLYALKKNLHANVRLLFVSLPLYADEFQPMGNELSELTRVVEFHLLSSLPDTHPIIVKRGCLVVNLALTGSI